VTGTGVAADFPIGIFVAANGNDSSAGNLQLLPHNSKAVSVAQTGDTIFVRGGHFIMDTITVGVSASGNTDLCAACLPIRSITIGHYWIFGNAMGPQGNASNREYGI